MHVFRRSRVREWAGRAAVALFVAPVIAAGALERPAAAVVIDRIGGGNTTAPADDPGWNNVGAIWIGGGVYLGNGWVLTANHIGSGSGFTVGGTTYAMVPGTGHQLTNDGAAGKSVFTDLFMFQIDAPPSLPALGIASVTPSLGDAVTLIGRGRDQQANETYWSVDTTTNPWTWTETGPSGADAVGFKTDASQTMRWGTNTIDWVGWGNVGVDVRLLGMTFDFGVSSDEAQVVRGDSGGAVFAKQGGVWNLAGIIIAQGPYSGQPGTTTTAVFGNGSYVADLSFYGPQIRLIMVPEPNAMAQAAVAAVAAGAAWWYRRGRRVRG